MSWHNEVPPKSRPWGHQMYRPSVDPPCSENHRLTWVKREPRDQPMTITPRKGSATALWRVWHHMKSRHLLCQVSEVQLVARTSLTVPLQGHGCQRMSKDVYRVYKVHFLKHWELLMLSCYHHLYLCKFISSAKLRRGGHHPHKEQRVTSWCHLLKAFKALLIGKAHLVLWRKLICTFKEHADL